MAPKCKTILSAGEIIHAILSEAPEVKAITSTILPVYNESELTLPYIIYQRNSIEPKPVKTSPGAESAEIEVSCYTESYGQSVELAEAVKEALDGVSATTDTMTMRSCQLVDGGESWADGAYIQTLIFNIKI